jgi:UDP-3-O-[3-hydroxymyristoyl] glucosamine N-acyltransferase
MRLGELARWLGAQLVDERDSGCTITHVAAADRAGAGALLFVEDERALGAAPASGASAVLLPPSLCAGTAGALAKVVHPQPRLAFARAARMLAPVEAPSGVHPLASVAETAMLGADISVDAFAVIGPGVHIGRGARIGAGAVLGADVIVGADCVLYPRAVLYPGVTLGDRVTVHAGAVLGADGFGYVRDPADGAYIQFPQQGTLVVEDDVEIGANTTIDRGALGETRIGRGTKIDNLVHLGHNVQIGADVVIAAQTGISGSSRVGQGAVIAGQVGIGDHAAVGPGVILGGQAGILPHKELLGPGELFWGTPAKPVKQFLRELVRLARLGQEKRGRDK